MVKSKKNREKRVAWHSEIILLSLISATLLGIIGISYIRKNALSLFSVSDIEGNIGDPAGWLGAIRRGDEKRAILYARRMVPDDVSVLPSPDYMHLITDNGLTSQLLTSPFNHFDYLRWKDAYEVRRVALKALKGGDNPIFVLCNEVMKKEKASASKDSMSLLEMIQVKEEQREEVPYTSIIDIWENGYASLNEIFRLISEMAYQLGYDVAVVGMYDKSFNLLHAVCEIRKDGKIFIFDPLYHKVWEGKSLPQLISEMKSNGGIWKKKVLNTVFFLYALPAEAVDYKLFNWKLQEKLKKSGNSSVPLFGESPSDRIDNYIRKKRNKSKKSRFTYWNFPFKSLKSSSELPDDWRSLHLTAPGNGQSEKK